MQEVSLVWDYGDGLLLTANENKDILTQWVLGQLNIGLRKEGWMRGFQLMGGGERVGTGTHYVLMSPTTIGMSLHL